VGTIALLDLTGHLKEIDALRNQVARLQAARTHTVRPGESPMTIAQRYTGNPTRWTELLVANPHKPRRGQTFATLVPGERLALPAGWA